MPRPHPMNDERKASLEALKTHIERIELPAFSRPPLEFGVPSIDRLLQGGLKHGRVHAFRGSAALGLLVALAARTSGPLLWCCRSDAEESLYMEGARQFGLAPERVMLAHCDTAARLLASVETALASGAVATTIAVLDEGCDRLAGRRLQLAAEKGGGIGLLSVAGRGALGWTETAWDVRSLPTGGSAPRWQVSLIRSRRSVTRAWNMEWEAHETALRLA